LLLFLPFRGVASAADATDAAAELLLLLLLTDPSTYKAPTALVACGDRCLCFRADCRSSRCCIFMGVPRGARDADAGDWAAAARP
jgi:hypothetical protein